MANSDESKRLLQKTYQIAAYVIYTPYTVFSLGSSDSLEKSYHSYQFPNASRCPWVGNEASDVTLRWTDLKLTHLWIMSSLVTKYMRNGA